MPTADFSFRPLVQISWGAFAPRVWRRGQNSYIGWRHMGGPARSLLVEEFHQGLSHALMRGGKQLRSLLMIQSFVILLH